MTENTTNTNLGDPLQTPDARIPVVNLAPFLSGEPDAMTNTANTIRMALESTGFFYITNHGISRTVRERLLQETINFYRLSQPEKDALKINEEGNGYVPNRGELPKTSDYYTGTRKPDVSECYLVQRDWGEGHLPVQNQWPSGMRSFEEAVQEFFDAAEDLCLRMLPLYAAALGLSSHFFDAKFRRHKGLNMLRVARMPPEKLGDDEYNIGPHTDSSFFTLLATSEQPGLEILLEPTGWTKMPLIPDAFVVNSGDMLTRWSNGRVRSTPHRVINSSGQYRYSVPFFLHPEPDAIIECLPSCHNGANPPREAPISSAAYLKWFMEQNFALGEQVYDELGQQVLGSGPD